jgi:hypothetical protein
MPMSDNNRQVVRPSLGRTLFAFLATIAILGLFRAFPDLGRIRKVWNEPPPRIDDRYVELLRALPPDQDFGYVCDIPFGTFEDEPVADRMLYQAQYALAPRVLWADDLSHRYVIANLADPSHLDNLCVKLALRPEFVSAKGTALLQRIDAP